jgi:hypothetical protein
VNENGASHVGFGSRGMMGKPALITLASEHGGQVQGEGWPCWRRGVWQIGNALRIIALETELSTYRPPFLKRRPYLWRSHVACHDNSAIAEPSIVLGEHTSPCFKTMHRILASRLS